MVKVFVYIINVGNFVCPKFDVKQSIGITKAQLATDFFKKSQDIS
jgi:hypothetical protein